MDFEVRNELVVMLQEDETAVIMAAEAVDTKDAAAEKAEVKAEKKGWFSWFKKAA